jgi:hypothetical protein
MGPLIASLSMAFGTMNRAVNWQPTMPTIPGNVIGARRFMRPSGEPGSTQRVKPGCSGKIMRQFQPPEPNTVWLTGLVEAMNEVASSAAKPSATDRNAFANRLELPALAAPLEKSQSPFGASPRSKFGQVARPR